MAKVAFYAVKNGREPGVYGTWAECESQVKGFPGAIYKKFGTEDAAREYIDSEKDEVSTKSDTTTNHKQNDPFHVSAYVDGSFNSETGEYGYGVYLDNGKDQQILFGREKQVDGGRNVEGEVAASRAALELLSRSSKCNSVTVYHDYQGIGSWADKNWRANKTYTKEYADFVQSVRDSGLDVEFVHVDGHTGVRGNEYVDKIAKAACGVPLSESDKTLLDEIRSAHGYDSLLMEMSKQDLQEDLQSQLSDRGIVFDSMGGGF